LIHPSCISSSFVGLALVGSHTRGLR